MKQPFWRNIVDTGVQYIKGRGWFPRASTPASDSDTPNAPAATDNITTTTCLGKLKSKLNVHERVT